MTMTHEHALDEPDSEGASEETGLVKAEPPAVPKRDWDWSSAMILLALLAIVVIAVLRLIYGGSDIPETNDATEPSQPVQSFTATPSDDATERAEQVAAFDQQWSIGSTDVFAFRVGCFVDAEADADGSVLVMQIFMENTSGELTEPTEFTWTAVFDGDVAHEGVLSVDPVAIDRTRELALSAELPAVDAEALQSCTLS